MIMPIRTNPAERPGTTSRAVRRNAATLDRPGGPGTSLRAHGGVTPSSGVTGTAYSLPVNDQLMTCPDPSTV